MPTRNISLTDHLDAFVEKQVSRGHFQNASEVVREGLRVLERTQAEHAAKLAWLKSAVAEAEASGPAREFSFADLDRRLDREARKERLAE